MSFDLFQKYFESGSEGVFSVWLRHDSTQRCLEYIQRDLSEASDAYYSYYGSELHGNELYENYLVSLWYSKEMKAGHGILSVRYIQDETNGWVFNGITLSDQLTEVYTKIVDWRERQAADIRRDW